MGLFRITIEGLGGHGVDRGKGDGETVYFDVDGETADFLAARLVLDLRAKGVEVKKATLEHWPADLGYDVPGPVDDLLTGIRTGRFE